MYFANRKGFTLIELLVVIAIIAILSTIGLSAFTSAQQRARDARRRGDMKAMQDSFEQYYAGNSNLYAACNTMAAQLQGGVLPTDPKGATAYTCNVNAANTQYCACAALETPGSGNATTNCPGAGAQPTWGTPAAGALGFHCVRNLQ